MERKNTKQFFLCHPKPCLWEKQKKIRNQKRFYSLTGFYVFPQKSFSLAYKRDNMSEKENAFITSTDKLKIFNSKMWKKNVEKKNPKEKLKQVCVLSLL